MLKSFIILCVSAGALFANNFESFIDEAYVKSEFTFEKGEKMKYAECKKKSYPTCTYIWGEETEKSLKYDARMKKYNLSPSGNTLMIVYAQASKLSDFDRVKKVFKDAEKVEGIGVNALLKGGKAFKQLSFITDKNMIISVSIDGGNIKDKNRHLINVAKHILSKLN